MGDRAVADSSWLSQCGTDAGGESGSNDDDVAVSNTLTGLGDSSRRFFSCYSRGFPFGDLRRSIVISRNNLS